MWPETILLAWWIPPAQELPALRRPDLLFRYAALEGLLAQEVVVAALLRGGEREHTFGGCRRNCT
jgi:hypothetical protein